MREIKFKARRTDNQEWAYGHYFANSNSHYIHMNGLNTSCPIERNTLCQLTGLTDVKDNLIWEGDILKHSDSEYEFKITFGGGSFIMTCVDTSHAIEYDLFKFHKYYEIIGSIH